MAALTMARLVAEVEADCRELWVAEGLGGHHRVPLSRLDRLVGTRRGHSEYSEHSEYSHDGRGRGAGVITSQRARWTSSARSRSVSIWPSCAESSEAVLSSSSCCRMKGGSEASTALPGACKGGGIGDFGGGSLEHPRRWRGVQRPGLCPGCAEPPRARPSHSQGEATPLGAPPPPRGLERAASKVADSDHAGARSA